MTDKKPVGRPPKKGENKHTRTISILPSVEAEIKKYHGSLTRFIEYAHLNDLIKIKLKK